MTAPAVIPQALPVIPQALPSKVETNQGPSFIAAKKTEPDLRPSVYWGDRFTIRFWIGCFSLMAAMNLFEAVNRLVLYLFGSSSPP